VTLAVCGCIWMDDSTNRPFAGCRRRPCFSIGGFVAVAALSTVSDRFTFPRRTIQCILCGCRLTLVKQPSRLQVCSNKISCQFLLTCKEWNVETDHLQPNTVRRKQGSQKQDCWTPLVKNVPTYTVTTRLKCDWSLMATLL